MNYINNPNLKIIVSEVDGIITDGTTLIDNMGFVVAKSWNLSDLEAISALKRGGYTFVFLSTDNHVSYNLLRARNIPFYWSVDDKPATLNKILHKYGYTPEELLYLGSKPSDYRCMSTAAVSICPSDCISKRDTTIVLPCSGGKGVLSYLSSMLRCF